MNRSLQLFILLFPCLYFSQEKQGIVHSNYSSTNSIFLNPSSSVASKTFLQFNIVGANAFVMTNLAYLPKFSLWNSLLTRHISKPVPSDIGISRYLYGTAGAQGPVLVISTHNFGAGLYARARSNVSVRRLPHQLTSLLLLQEPMGPQEFEVNVNNGSFSSMSWLEYGANLGMIAVKKRSTLISAGANIKYLSGANIVHANIDEMKGFYSNQNLRIDTLKGNLRFNELAYKAGRGYGLDLGITYHKMLEAIDAYFPNSPRSACKYVGYKYKIGLSLRDIGYIRYTNTTFNADYNGSGNFLSDRNERSYRQAMNLDMNSPLLPKPITALMPLSISGQFDYNFENGIYLAGLVVKNMLPSAVIAAPAPDLIAITPRFELKNIEVSTPLSFQRFLYPQLGLAFRIRSFVLGVDNLFPLTFRKNTYGLGIYFNLGFSLFKNPACRAKNIRVDDCMPRNKTDKNKKASFWKRIFGKTYSK